MKQLWFLLYPEQSMKLSNSENDIQQFEIVEIYQKKKKKNRGASLLRLIRVNETLLLGNGFARANSSARE